MRYPLRHGRVGNIITTNHPTVTSPFCKRFAIMSYSCGSLVGFYYAVGGIDYALSVGTEGY